MKKDSTNWLQIYQIGIVCITKTVNLFCHICDCPKSGPGFPMSYDAVIVMLNALRREVIVLVFVNISGIVDHHCLHFLFIISKQNNIYKYCMLGKSNSIHIKFIN